MRLKILFPYISHNSSILCFFIADTFCSELLRDHQDQCSIEINNDMAISWKVAKRSRSRLTFADCFVCFVCLHARGITLAADAAAVASLSPGAQLSSCKLLHFSSTNRIAECLGHYVYIQGYELPGRALAAILCTRAPIKDAAREHCDRSEG